MAVKLFKNGKPVTNEISEEQAFGGIFNSFDDYKKYYESHGYQVQQVGAPKAYKSTFQQFNDYVAGRGDAPEGLQKGYAAPPPSGKTNALAQGLMSADGANTQSSAAGEIRVLMPNQSTQFFRIDDPALDAALGAGARPVGDDGIYTDVRKLDNGGWVVGSGGGYIPLNVFSGGDWLPGQQEELARLGLQVGAFPNTTGGTSGGGQGGGGGGGGTGAGGYRTNGWMGNQNINAEPLPEDLEDALRVLMQEARTQGLRGQEALTGLVDDYKNYLGFARAAAEQTFNKRNMLSDMLIGDVRPGIQSALGTMNEATGLSPEGMQALRVNAIEGPERAYQGQAEQLKTSLAQRGAFGGGALPGDAGAMIRGYAPLMQGRDASRSSLLANTILSDEQRKFETLGLNRQTALGAMGTGAGLATGMANAYNPSSLFGANEAALSGLGNTLASRANAGFQGLDLAGQFGGSLINNQPTSFKNLLLASLLGTGGSILSNPDVWDKIGGFFGGLFGGGGNNNSDAKTPPYVP